jgi:L,D-peptidoglycan transpeptidase YkuD (ErfK/YbiS/YcfS/YnhG family)
MNDIIHVVGRKLTFGNKIYVCAIGKGGFSTDKKEGDGCTPLGIFSLRELWYRADKIPAPQTHLPIKIIHENDGWCDDPKSPDYNRYIRLSPSLRGGIDDAAIQTGLLRCARNDKYNFSHEKLWRADDVYDLIIPIGYNDKNIVAGKGSAIFIHVARENYEPTEGCIALRLADLLEILPLLSTNTQIEIKA